MPRNGKVVTELEAKRQFLLAFYSGKRFDKRGTGVSLDEIEEYRTKISKRLEEMGQSQIDRMVETEYGARLELYNSLAWARGQIPLAEAGVYPGMKGLDLNLTTGNVIDTAQKIAELNGLAPPGLLECIESISQKLDYTRSRFPLIVVPGGTIRNREKYVGHRTSEQQPIISQYDIDDGSTRAIAYALASLTGAPALIGTRKD
jgi:hypothetical protein